MANRRAASPSAADEAVTRGSGNVFADLGYADAEERQTKLRLAYAINEIIAAKRLSQGEAAAPPRGILPDGGQAPRLKPRPPQMDGRPTRAEALGDLAWRDPLGGQEHDPRAEVQPPGGGPGPHPPLHDLSVGVTDRQCPCSRRHGLLPPLQRHDTMAESEGKAIYVTLY